MWEKSPEGNCCSFIICRLKSLHDSGVGMCSAGSSNVNILHPPSHSPVPGPGIPLPSNGRLVTHSFFFLFSFCCTQTLFFCPCATTSNHLFPSFLYLPHTFLHFLFAAILHSSFISSFHLLFFPPSPSTTLHPSLSLFLFLSLPQLLLSHFGFICMAERKGCRQCEQGQQSPPVSIQARAEICNARQQLGNAGIKKLGRPPPPPQTKRALFFPVPPFPALIALLAWRRRILRAISFSEREE